MGDKYKGLSDIKSSYSIAYGKSLDDELKKLIKANSEKYSVYSSMHNNFIDPIGLGYNPYNPLTDTNIKNLKDEPLRPKGLSIFG
jgi:hypothetical protein